MKILSWNVRGLGSKTKHKRVKETTIKAAPDVVLIQETKLKTLDDLVVRDVWESRFKGWECLPSVGALGGVLVIWDNRFATKVDSIHGIFSVFVLLDIRGRGQWWISSVYGPNSPRLRSMLWDELGFLCGFCGSHWCMGGDFNVIRSPAEKLNGNRLTSSMKEFDSLIRECSLRDIPLSNARFTWSARRHYTVASRLDRFLFSSAWEDVFPDLVQESLPRQSSDHFPIVLESSKVMWGPTPFRFENMWCNHHSFIPFIKDIWNSSSVEGLEGFKFMRKLKALKDNLKEWNKTVFRDIRIRKENVLKEIDCLDRMEVEGNLSEDLNENLKKLRL